jgi:hypothetical protein
MDNVKLGADEPLELDPSLPEPQLTKIRDIAEHLNKRVKVYGFVHRLRQQSKLQVIRFSYNIFRQEPDVFGPS